MVFKAQSDHQQIIVAIENCQVLYVSNMQNHLVEQ